MNMSRNGGTLLQLLQGVILQVAPGLTPELSDFADHLDPCFVASSRRRP
jgi:hypothetical protein